MKNFEQRFLDWFIFFAVVSAICLTVSMIILASGCSTVTPKPVTAGAVAFSVNDQTAGIIGAAPAGSGYVVNADFRARYNALVAIYGKDILPPITADAGLTALTDGTWVIDKQHLVDEILMADWHRMGRSP